MNEGRAGRWWALAALVVSGLVIGLDSTVLITALPTLSSKLGATTSDLPFGTAAPGLSRGSRPPDAARRRCCPASALPVLRR